MLFLLFVTMLLLVKYVSGTVYFVETFDNEKSLLENKKAMKKRWVESNVHTGEEKGEWILNTTST